MPKQGSRRNGPRHSRVGDPSDPEGLVAYLERFLEWMRVSNYAEHTVDGRARNLRLFIAWCDERAIKKPQEITRPILERYQRYLYHYRKKNGEPLSFRSQHTRLVPVRAFFKWLARHSHILYNPAAELELPKLEQRLPKHVLTQSEAEQVINQADVTTAIGLRDRAILETLYSTGIRRMEVINLKLFDLDAERGTLIVRQGKGKKDRMVPIGARATAWIEKYLNDVRPQLIAGEDTGHLYLTNLGEVLTPNHLTQIVKNYVDAAELGKTGSCHLFRHTMATLMLENGADIRFIQQMLGHARLDTTQIYTQVSIRMLKEIHTATHPARMERALRAADARAATRDEDDAAIDDDGEPGDSPAALLETLSKEPDDDPE